MGIGSKFLVAGSLAVASMAHVSSAHAQSATIANASELVANSQPFSLSTTGGTGGTYTLNAVANTGLNYISSITTPSTPSNGGGVNSLLTSFAATNGVYASTGFGYTVTFSEVAGHILSSGGGQNYLSFDFPAGANPGTTNVTLYYFSASNNATLLVSASEASNSAKGLSDFTSDIYNFNTPSSNPPGGTIYQESFQLSLQSVNAASGGINNGFNSDGSFIFSSNPGPTALPEPSSVAMSLLGAGVAFLPIVRRKRSK